MTRTTDWLLRAVLGVFLLYGAWLLASNTVVTIIQTKMALARCEAQARATTAPLVAPRPLK